METPCYVKAAAELVTNGGDFVQIETKIKPLKKPKASKKSLKISLEQNLTQLQEFPSASLAELCGKDGYVSITRNLQILLNSLKTT